MDIAKYVRRHERDKLPRITFVKDDERQKKFDHRGLKVRAGNKWNAVWQRAMTSLRDYAKLLD